MKDKKQCIICEEESKYDLCKKCYEEMNNIKNQLEDFIWYLDATKNHYYEIKSKIYYLKNMEYVRYNCLKLIALSEFIENYFDQIGFIEKAKKEVIELIYKKKKYLGLINESDEDKIKEDINSKDNESIFINNEELEDDYRNKFVSPYRCKDGHYVKSKAERIIDDYFFLARIIHVYEQAVYNEENNETYYPDFYLPYEGKSEGENKGIYIEYFGLDNDEYSKKAKKKMKFYKSKKFDFIEIRECNMSNLEDYLDRSIKKINRKYRK